MATNINHHLTPIQGALQEFKPMRVMHTRIHQVMKELQVLIYPGSQDSLFLVCGPTGIGKTTLARHLVDNELKKWAQEMQHDAGVIPAVFVEAEAAGEKDFSWRSFYRQLLEQLEVVTDIPRYDLSVDAATGRMRRPHRSQDNSLAGMLTAVKNALRERGTRFLVIDEAAHIIQQSRGADLLTQLTTLKSIANRSNTQIILVGSYDLYPLVSLSAQLARRTHVIHFERYRQDRAEDVRAFRSCVQKFQDALPGLWGDQLMEFADVLHADTFGCVGTLSTVLSRAARFAQAQGHWSPTALEKALQTQAQRETILEEILDGERAINPGVTRILAKSQKLPNTARKAA